MLRAKSREYGHAIYIVADEPYREITYGAEVPYIPDIYPDTVICYSYSKSLSLPGERIGYIALPDCISSGDRLYAARLRGGPLARLCLRPGAHAEDYSALCRYDLRY